MEGITSPSSDTSLPFLSHFLFLSAGSEGEVWTRRGVEGRVWMDTLGVDPPACDSRSFRRLVFCLHWSTMASGTLEGSWRLLTCEGKWVKVAKGDSIEKDWSKTPKSSLKSSLESTTSINSVVSSLGTGFERVASSSKACWASCLTWWVPAGGGPLRKPGTAILIWCSRESFAFMMYFGDWKLMDIGLYPRIMWTAHSGPSVWRKILDLRILVRLGSLTKLRLGSVKFFSAKSPKTKVLLERRFVK